MVCGLVGAGFGTTQTASTGGGLFGGGTQQSGAGTSLFSQGGGRK